MKHLSFILILLFSLNLTAQDNSSINMNINMNMNMSIEGNTNQPETQQSTDMNIDLNMQENSQTQTHTNQNVAPSTTTQTVYVSGYNGEVGCSPPVSSERIEDMSKTVEKQTFNDDKVRVTKQIIRSNCITLDQLIIILNKFDWDDGKLEIAKFAYDYVYDLENYYKVYDLFTFSSSGKELEEFLDSKY